MNKSVVMITCVDIGSANIFLQLIKDKSIVYNILASGVAATKLKDNSVDFVYIDDSIKYSNKLDKVFNEVKPNLLLCGTSWGMTLDKKATNIAKNRGVRTVSIIDHWTLLRQRYCNVDDHSYKNDLAYLTDYCIVIDERVACIAEKEGIEKEKLLIAGQPYLESIWNKFSVEFKDYNNKSNNKDLKVLFVSENIKDDIGRLGDLIYHEYTVLKDLKKLAINNNYTLDIKLHPQEDIDKYSYLKLKGSNIYKNMSFETMVKDYNYVIGMDSMLLIEISLFRDNVISYRPGYNGYYHLPDTIHSIVEINDISSLENYLLDSNNCSRMFPNDDGNKFTGSLERVIKIINDLSIIK